MPLTAGRHRPPPVDVLDVVVAVGMTIALQVEIWAPRLFGGDTQLTHRPLLSLTSLLVAVSLVWRRRNPWPAAILAYGAVVSQSFLATPPDGLAGLAALLLVSYSLGRWTHPPMAYAGSALIGVTALTTGQDGADVVFVLLVLGVAWVSGLAFRRRADDLDDLALARLAAQKEGAEEERLRIARELHDVVAHRVSMMVVQSQLADTVLDDDPAAARRAVQAVEQAGRDALEELRSVLGLLHDDRATDRRPETTDLTRLSALVEAAQRGGVPATLVVTGTERRVSPMVALATLRIVQESLTNVVKHAAGAASRVELSYRPAHVLVQVSNDGARVGTPLPGHGLAGMAERAAFVGGTFEAQPREGGGFTVRALLPTPEVPS
jgi:signal transduction histidine kinase